MRDICKRLLSLEQKSKPIEKITLHFEDGKTESLDFLDAVSAILSSAALDIFADEFPVNDSTTPRVVDATGKQSNFINALLGRAEAAEGVVQHEE